VLPTLVLVFLGMVMGFSAQTVTNIARGNNPYLEYVKPAIIIVVAVIVAMAASRVPRNWWYVAAIPMFAVSVVFQALVLSPLGMAQGGNRLDLKRVGGGLLVQSPDEHRLTASALKVVTKRQPTPQQLADLLFAWQVAHYVKSNAIVYCGNGQTLGIGAGQMSRVDSARIASIKAANAGLDLQGSVVASDAFFPFRDGLDVVVDAGATAVIQPGGSMRDQEVIDAANERDVCMVFTGVRHFRH